MINLPLEIIDYVFMFDDSKYKNYNKCILEINQRITQKKLKKKLIDTIFFVSNGPFYRVPGKFNDNSNIYLLTNIIRNNF